MRNPFGRSTARRVGIQCGEEHVRREHAGLRQAIEQRRLSSVGVANQRNNRIRHSFAAVAVQLARAFDPFELSLDARDPFLDQPSVGFDLGFAGSSEEAEPPTLSLEVCPRTDKSAFLVGKMRELDLQRALPVRARRPKISRISPVRSRTFALHARSRLRC